MPKTIVVPDEVYKSLEEAAKDRGMSLDVLLRDLVTNLSPKGKKISWHESFKQDILKKNPELAHWTKEQFQKEFDRLSKKAADGLKFQRLEDMERFMRREEIDPKQFDYAAEDAVLAKLKQRGK